MKVRLRDNVHSQFHLHGNGYLMLQKGSRAESVRKMQWF